MVSRNLIMANILLQGSIHCFSLLSGKRKIRPKIVIKSDNMNKFWNITKTSVISITGTITDIHQKYFKL